MLTEMLFCLYLHHQNERAEQLFGNAKVAQLVEHDLAKVGVASSNLVFRSIPSLLRRDLNFKRFLKPARVVELVDTQDLKSCSP